MVDSINGTFSLGETYNLTSRDFVQHLLDDAVSRVNSGVSMTLTARQAAEYPPQDSRHLTDTRARVSTLLEYSVAYEMNHILLEQSHGHSISAVLWNVFPDLIVRDKQRNNILGLEVKALHTAAEEKSANFETSLQLIRRDKDFVVILIWGWQTHAIGGTAITYPHIHAANVFDAWLLAKIRDYGWLFNQKKRVKGIDLCSPIIDGEDTKKYKAEEGNAGKLMRIGLPKNLPTSTPDYAAMKAEDDRYKSFSQKVLALGLRETFIDICALDGARIDSTVEPERYPSECTVLGNATRVDGSQLFLMAGPKPQIWLSRQESSRFAENSRCIWLSQKLNWNNFTKKNDTWISTGNGEKPDSDLDAIIQAVNA